MNERFANLVELWQFFTEKYAARPYLGTKSAGTWSYVSYADFKRQVDAFRAGLSRLGVGVGDRVALVANNRLEWAVAAYATYGLRAAIVPLYEAQAPSEWAFVLKDSGARVALGSTSAVLAGLEQIRGELPELEHVIGLSLPPGDERSYAWLSRWGAEHPTPVQLPEPHDPAGFLYTSGTTGQPKGAILTHANVISNVNELRRIFPLSTEDRSLAFLPWAHALGQTGELHMLSSVGCSIAINDEIPNLLSNLSEVKPTLLIAVPRIFNRIYDGVNKQMADRPAPIQALFRTAIRAATARSRGEELGLVDRAALGLADKLIFSKIRGRVGGRLRYAVSGSAALSREVAEFVDALGIEVYEGYGLTETSPVVSVNYPGHRRIGSVGKPLAGVRVEIDKAVTGDAENGEIVVYGPCVMRGYHHRDDETRQMLGADGGLRTGDMGRVDKDGFLYITGRIKEQYKLENGKYVVPSPLEEQLKLSPYIVNVMLFGHNKPHNVALVVLDVEAVKKWSEAQGGAPADLTRDERVRALVRAELDRHAEGFRGYERPKAFALLTEDFTVENGLLTPSLKLKRQRVLERYGANLEALYKP